VTDSADPAAVDELRLARMLTVEARHLVEDADQDIRAWQRERQARTLSAIALVLLLIAATVALLIGHTAPGAAWFALAGLMAALRTVNVHLIDRRLHGEVPGSQARRAAVLAEYASAVEEYDDALRKLRTAEAGVPVWMAWPELHPEGQLELPTGDAPELGQAP
jgi:hypothetical protein